MIIKLSRQELTEAVSEFLKSRHCKYKEDLVVTGVSISGATQQTRHVVATARLVKEKEGE